MEWSLHGAYTDEKVTGIVLPMLEAKIGKNILKISY